MSLLQNQLDLAAINLRQNQLESASQRLSSTIQSTSPNSTLHLNRGIVNFGLKKYQQANKDLQICKTVSALYYAGYYNKFVAFYKRNKKKNALQSLIYSIVALEIQQAISEKSASILRKIIKQCDFIISGDQTKGLQIKLSLIKQVFQSIENSNSQQIQLQLKQKLERFKDLLKAAQSKNLQQKIKLRNDEKDIIIISKKIIQRNLQEEIKILSELKKIIIEENQKNQLRKTQQKSQEKGFYQITQNQNKSQNIHSLNLNNENQSHVLQLYSHIKPNQNQIFSPKKRQNNNDDSFNINQMSLQMKKNVNPKAQIDNSQNNISSASYKKNKAKKKEELYPCMKKNQQIQVKIVMGQITNNKQLIGNMDPFCVLQYNGQTKKTSVMKGGGLNPRWNQIFKFKLTQNRSQLSIKVYDRERFKFRDDFIGQGRYVVQKIGFAKIPIYEKQTQAGYIFISIDSK